MCHKCMHRHTVVRSLILPLTAIDISRLLAEVGGHSYSVARNLHKREIVDTHFSDAPTMNKSINQSERVIFLMQEVALNRYILGLWSGKVYMSDCYNVWEGRRVNVDIYSSIRT